ncbi:DEAD/DEAH box helicase [Flaviflexus huanghaiensis]|uniref:DEAD/DEAH box helicase n=1 Tax=Flaviflexus huanghaiensis TaxID=1111473 RepID=UPI0015F91C11|nr:DEAD/DEAH box helicase [Flaviflexus huanghaiensis]
MATLIPVHAANNIRDGINEYLATSFSLADPDMAEALKQFFSHPETGMFHGPYVRTRLPYAQATDWEEILDWLPNGFVPYHHQAEAFARLRTKDENGRRDPDPTIVITGTGSGKTESFLMPILDHARRARMEGEKGVKALILYPMNALANDQADRIAKLIWDNDELHGLTAGIYTGEATSNRTTMSRNQLITDRSEMQRNPPDILLTNYKMLDQLLLRPADREIWAHSATSLQYLVLDEFHTYDGAQGTDVALLLRRLGLMLKRFQPAGFLTEEESSRCLGRLTPVATSATLGAKGENQPVLDFAETVFGMEFDEDCIVPETLLSLDEWRTEMLGLFGASTQPAEQRTVPTADEIEGLLDALAGAADRPDYDERVFAHFCEQVWGCRRGADGFSLDEAIANAAQHELTALMLTNAGSATPLIRREQDGVATLPDLVLGEESRRLGEEKSVEFMSHALAALSYLRSKHGERDPWGGKRLPGVEAHLWLRELSRVDRSVGTLGEGVFRWSDDGATDGNAESEATFLPACYCRSCGRSGWMVSLEPGTGAVILTPQKVREDSVRNGDRTRALIDATQEQLYALAHDRPVAGLRSDGTSAVLWLHTNTQQLSMSPPAEGEEEELASIPVLTHYGPDAEDASKDQTCPSCGEQDAIRYIGSSVATLLSVSLSNLFGMPGLDDSEKKTLVFTDSVQDAAHRAGFVQARSRAFALRTQIRRAIDSSSYGLDEIPEALTRAAGDDCRSRYQLLPPEIADYTEFKNYWDPTADRREQRKSEKKVEDRLAFDALLEFGQRADLARSLVSTGALNVAVDAPGALLDSAGREAMDQVVEHTLDTVDGQGVTAWVHGILEMIRIRGGINHRWFERYLQDDGNAYLLNRRQERAQGVPAFPRGGSPEFPRVGSPLSSAKRDYGVAAAGSPTGRYARWTSRMLGLTPHDSARAVSALLGALSARGFLTAVNTNSGATIYAIEPEHVVITSEDNPHLLECGICRASTGLAMDVRDLLDDAPCFVPSCQGTLHAVPVPDNYYRRLYAATTPRSVVAREHTGMLENTTRKELEDAFRGSGEGQAPDAPNVLVATPTLEMGIDIGDLSTVMLSSLPNTVASYVQRVGRAGRLTGNSLALALIRGRGEVLPKLNEPLSIISGMVTPPAAFLSAVEILERQFTAYLIDTLPLDDMVAKLHTSFDVFDHSPGNPTLIDVLVDSLDSTVDRALDEFIPTIADRVDESTTTQLRAWARGDSVANLRSKLEDARREWLDERQSIAERIANLQEQVEAFEAMDDAGDDDVIQERREVRSSLRFERSRRKTLLEEHWVTALERYGILPNFTLLDDAVELSVHVTRLDPQTFEFETQPYNYSRGISAALTELAPGSTFYAQGIAAKIDSVEIGRDGEAVQKWRICAQCSYSELEWESQRPSCPICHDPRFADTGAVIDVLPLKKVYSEVEQTSAAINDSRDERTSAMYAMHMSFVVPEGAEDKTWYTQDGFGAAFMSRVDLRWLNLGRGEGPELTVGGRTVSAPLFRVCQSCGHVDSQAGSNSKWDHRPWCPQRHSHEEKSISFALGRTLRTQGVLLYLPERYSSNADRLAIPSLTAAIRLGFKEVLGGNPAHLEVDSVRVMGERGPVDALLLSDSIYGGTGYLYQFAKPEDVRRLLTAALETVSACPCQFEDRMACPRCLIPFARRAVQSTSRAAAEAVLRSLLLASRSPEPGTPITGDEWEIMTSRPAITEGSHLENRFREMLLAALEALPGVTVTQSMSGGRSEWQFTMPAAGVSPAGIKWRMREQHSFGYTVPDFYFEPMNSNARPIAVFLDGAAYHVSPANNRVDGDVRKRARLYEEGIQPFALTSRDLDRRQSDSTIEPAWFGTANGEELARRSCGLSATNYSLVKASPFDLLLKILERPDNPAWEDMRHVAAAFVLSKGAERLDNGLVGAIHGGGVRVEAQPNGSGGIRSNRLIFDTTPGYPSIEQWNDFLNLANLYWLSNDPAEFIDVHSTETVGQEEPSVATPVETPVEESISSVVSSEWQEILEEFEGEGIEESLQLLIDEGVPVADEIGSEISGIPALLMWTSAKIAMLYDDEGDPAALGGWTVFGAKDLSADRIPTELKELARR